MVNYGKRKNQLESEKKKSMKRRSFSLDKFVIDTVVATVRHIHQEYFQHSIIVRFLFFN